MKGIIKDKEKDKYFDLFNLPANVLVVVCSYLTKPSILSLALSCKKFGQIITKNKMLINRHIIARQRKISPRIFDKKHLIQLARFAKVEDKPIYYEQIQYIFHADFNLSYDTNAKIYAELIVEGRNPNLAETEYKQLILMMDLDNIFFHAIDPNYDFSTLAQYLLTSLILTCEQEHRNFFIFESQKFFDPFLQPLLSFDASTCSSEEFLNQIDTAVQDFQRLLLKYKGLKNKSKKKFCMIV